MVYNPIKRDRCGRRSDNTGRSEVQPSARTLVSLRFSSSSSSSAVRRRRVDTISIAFARIFFFCVCGAVGVGGGGRVKRFYLVLGCNLISWHIWEKKAGFSSVANRIWGSQVNAGRILQRGFCWFSIPGREKKDFRGSVTILKLNIYIYIYIF